MAKVKFVHTVKYKGKRIPAHTPFEVPDNEVETLKADGAIVIEMSKPQEVETKRKVEVDITPEELSKFSIKDLRSFATKHNIYVPSTGSKADIFNTIVKALK